jgi:predicted small metal-binding protein
MLRIYIHMTAWWDYKRGENRKEGHGGRSDMEKVIQCPCGTALRAEDEGELVAKAPQHAKELHGMELTREQALAMAQPV